MKTHSSSCEDCLKNEIRSWLRCALADILALPTAPEVHEWEHADLALALSRSRHAIDAVRLYASECLEVASAQYLSAHTVHLAELAEQMCRNLEEEVDFAEDELLTYAC